MAVIKFSYIPTDTQAKFHSASELQLLFGGSVGGGKTAAVCADAIAFGSQYNTDIIMGRADYSDFRITTEVEFEKLCPRQLVTKWHKSYHEVTFIENPNALNYNDRIIDGRTYAGRQKPTKIIMTGMSVPEKLKGFTAGAVYIDELSGLPIDSYNMLLSRLREPSMHHTEYRLRAASNPVANWVKDKFIKMPKTAEEARCKYKPDPYFMAADKHCEKCVMGCQEGKNIRFVASYIKDNPFLPANYAAVMYASYPEDLARMLVQGDWDALGGAVFPEVATLQYTQHFQIPADWTRFMAIDPHARTPTHVLWVAASPAGKIYVYRELVMADTIKNISAVIKSKEEGEQIFYRIIDTSANSDDVLTGMNIMDEFSKHGVTCVPASKGNHIGYNRIKEALKANKIFIMDTCPVFKEQFQNLVWDEYKSKITDMGKEKLQMWKKINDHAFDCFKYIMILEPGYVTPQEWVEKANYFTRELHAALEKYNVKTY